MPEDVLNLSCERRGSSTIQTTDLPICTSVHTPQQTFTGRMWQRWFNAPTVQLRTLSLVPSPTGTHPSRGDSGVCICVHVCLVWSVFQTAFIVSHHLPVCRQLHTDCPGQLDSIWTWSIAHMRSESSSPTGDQTRVARLAVQCSTNWTTPCSVTFTGHKHYAVLGISTTS